MELPVALQGSQFLLAVIFGAVYGLVYDLLRGLRRNLRAMTQFADLLFCLLCLLGNLLFAFYIGQGEYRIFMLIAGLLGALIYFLSLSRIIFPTFQLLWRLILLPFRKIRLILGKTAKKSLKISKKLFSFWKKSVKIKKRREKEENRKNHRQEGSDRAPAQVIADHNAHTAGAAGILHHHRLHSSAKNS